MDADQKKSTICLIKASCSEAKTKVRVFNFYLQALSTKRWSPKGWRGKEILSL